MKAQVSTRVSPYACFALLSIVLLLGFEAQAQASVAPVYRFWSDYYGGHFFTISAAERDYIRQSYPDTWSYEGSDWSALTEPEGDALPVYRFWSDIYHVHFFTISETEKEYIINNYQGWWGYEGVGWYAYAFDGQGRKPIFRFWSDMYQSHFYTGNAGERDYIVQHYPAWNYEGVAWYAPTEAVDDGQSQSSEDADGAQRQPGEDTEQLGICPTGYGFHYTELGFCCTEEYCCYPDLSYCVNAYGEQVAPSGEVTGDAVAAQACTAECYDDWYWCARACSFGEYQTNCLNDCDIEREWCETTCN